VKVLAGAAVAGSAALAAAALWAVGGTDWGPLLHGAGPGGHGHAGAAPVLEGAAWLAGWGLMVVAMMLPTATRFLGRVRGRGARAFATAGFLGAWGASGVVLLALVAPAGAAGERLGWIGARPHLAAAAALVLAGAYQGSRVKARCLARCRAHARVPAAGADPSGDALRAGVAQGLSSLGCCWPLMAAMVVAGLGGIWWMAAVAAVAAAEACAAVGPRLRVPLGAALVAAGVLVLVTGVPPPA
jgi:predicted metal-binding membrane protein